MVLRFSFIIRMPSLLAGLFVPLDTGDHLFKDWLLVTAVGQFLTDSSDFRLSDIAIRVIIDFVNNGEGS